MLEAKQHFYERIGENKGLRLFIYICIHLHKQTLEDYPHKWLTVGHFGGAGRNWWMEIGMGVGALNIYLLYYFDC